MQRSAGGPYVCWRCLSRRLQPKPSLVRRPFSVARGRSLRALQAHVDGARSFATIQEPVVPPNHVPADPADLSDHTALRRRLRQWEAQNTMQAPTPLILDAGDSGGPRNILSRASGTDMAAIESANPASVADQRLLEREGSFDLLPPPSTYQPGDLVESRQIGYGTNPVISICLGHINGYYHFYTMTGQWVVLPTMTSHFVYRNFVDEAQLAPIIAKLPKDELPLMKLAEMSRLDMGPDRVTGAVLLRRMNDFMEKKDQMLQKYATRFEKAHELVTEKDGRYLTLDEIGQRLLLKNDLKSPVPAHIMYAVHQTVILDDVGFRIVANLGDSTTWLFEVSSREDVSLIQNMQILVRLFTDLPGRVGVSLASLTNSQLAESQLGRFILKARNAIDTSRQFRDWTPHGILGPAKQRKPKTSTVWTNVDMSILHFVLLWAGYNQFSLSSRFHWIGSTILRATGRYKDSEYLSTSTAWTFLQELGYLTPWDLHERYVGRVPDVKISRERGFAPFPLGPEGIRPYLTKDIFDGKRHDWVGLKAFAIDSESTADVDDAVSIEATDVPDQHWVHIHVADPASRVRHQNALAERASLTPLTLYLSGHYSNIWGVEDQVQKLFSLAPNRPCLTFSGLLNEDGELLEYKITPGKVHDFVYMSPQDANAAVGDKNQSRVSTDTETERFTVGKIPKEKPLNREMTAASELQPADLESLKTLYRLAHAVRQKRLDKGAIPSWPPGVSVTAHFDDTSIERTPPGILTCNGDPAIEISLDNAESPMVTSMMVLAGEIGARWSADRNIPIPYLSQPLSVKNHDLLVEHSSKIYFPLMERGEDPNGEQWAKMRTLVGPDELSTTPGPHFFMGVDAYSKVTSPLRRYSDLIAHWQIENALVQEMDTGKIVEEKLPFARQDLDEHVLPWLRLRQQIIKRLGNHSGTEAYILQALVRAWKYPNEPNSSKLPETFRMTIRLARPGSPQLRLKILSGRLDWFGLDGWLVPQGLSKLGLDVTDVREGDVFEVKLVDVNVHSGDVLLEATGKVSVQKDGEVD